ncbi:hypothetical protein [Paracnuella aquatica]|uniref:hypothetical protein n=1 Tax=Paracnuella aquatica TaxID=2268757 RepID=UPI000DEF3B21|nr:hypothetical protein [Paracnuella aquatica]RPD44435.1 hypothetical protein DRJ53_17105 [Paracnuella aquatica]
MKTTLPANEAIPRIETAIQRGLDYLEQHQFPHGEFVCYMGGDEALQGWTLHVNMLFPTTLICDALLQLPQTPQVAKMLQQAGWFLRAHMGPGGTWHHYTWMAAHHEVLPYDVDDSSCVSSVLQRLGIDHPHQSLRRLLLGNRNSKGLFYTWFAFRWRWNTNKTYWRLALREFLAPVKGLIFWKKMECSRNDVDAVVNANVLTYLGEGPETEPVVAWIKTIIENGEEARCDKYYCNPLSVHYFFARSYAAGVQGLELVRQKAMSRVLAHAQPDGSFGASALETALAVCALVNWGYDGAELAAACSYLLLRQQSNGCWPRWCLYYGGPAKRSTFGSEELTTAICLQALSQHAQLRIKKAESNATAGSSVAAAGF